MSGPVSKHSKARDDEPEEIAPPDPPLDRADMYKIAFEASIRVLQDQAEVVPDMRARVATYLGFIATATAVLVNAGIKAQHRDGLFMGLAITGTVMMTLCITCVIALLWPGLTRLAYHVSPVAMIDNVIERDRASALNITGLYRELALYNDAAITDNEYLLRGPRTIYICAILLGAAQLIVWIVLTWVRS